MPITHLKAFADIAGVNGECDESDPPKDPDGARDGQVIELGLDEFVGMMFGIGGYLVIVRDRLDVRQVRPV